MVVGVDLVLHDHQPPRLLHVLRKTDLSGSIVHRKLRFLIPVGIHILPRHADRFSGFCIQKEPAGIGLYQVFPGPVHQRKIPQAVDPLDLIGPGADGDLLAQSRSP